MSTLNRRQFAQSSAALLIGSTSLASRLCALDSASSIAGQLRADLSAPSTPFNRMLFGQFLEHFQRQVYGGVFEPGSSLSDKSGLRLDVIEALRELHVPVV